MKNLKALVGVISVLLFYACGSPGSGLTSPDEEITVKLLISNGSPVYLVQRGHETVIDSSALGILFDGMDLSRDVELTNVSSVSTIKDEYEMLHGKQRQIAYEANEQIYTLKHESGTEYQIIFRVSDDGVAFRYFIPGTDTEIHQIDEEFTSFNFPDETRAWMQHMANAKTGFAETNPSYEENYSIDIEVGTPAPDTAGWIFPALFNTGENWVLISETGMDGTYPGTKLDQFSEGGEYHIAFPQWGEQFTGGALDPESELPWATPWRIMAIGDLKTVTESTLGTDLADPAEFEDVSWIKPGRAAWSWAKLKDESVNYDTQKEFIDYAADMGWEYVLVDVNWDQNIGYDGIAELADYASEKKVGLILWYNSSGDWNTTVYSPKSKLLTHEDRVSEFSRIHEIGVKGIKVDFFAGDGQSIMQYYLDIFKDAAEYELLVNTHGATIPRGWHRTWPNLMTMESVKGFEFVTFFQPNADQEAVHSAMLPFTRNVFSPMDYTPMSPTAIPNIDRKSTPAFQVAQAVIFTSGIQHYAETPAGMEEVPGFAQEIIKQIPVDWDEIKFVDGYPGEFAVIARKYGDSWFVAGINAGQEPKEVRMDLSFISEDLTGTALLDGEGSEMFKEKMIESGSAVNLTMKPTGGFVILFENKN